MKCRKEVTLNVAIPRVYLSAVALWRLGSKANNAEAVLTECGNEGQPREALGVLSEAAWKKCFLRKPNFITRLHWACAFILSLLYFCMWLVFPQHFVSTRNSEMYCRVEQIIIIIVFLKYLQWNYARLDSSSDQWSPAVPRSDYWGSRRRWDNFRVRAAWEICCR